MSLIIITPSVCKLWPWWSAADDDDDDSEVTYCPLRSVRSPAPALVRFRASWRPGLWSQTACTFPCCAPRTAETVRRRSSSVRSYPPAMTPCTGSPRRYESACPSPAKTHRNIKRVRLNLAFVHVDASVYQQEHAAWSTHVPCDNQSLCVRGLAADTSGVSVRNWRMETGRKTF